MSVTNSTILDRCRLVATNDYQQRIPPTTQGGIASTMRALFDPLNREYWNQFIDILVNRIGMTIVRGDQWDNPLAAFKGARLDYGSTIQEIAPQWITAHSYDDADETLLKLARPEAAAWYHSQNRRDKYKISINEQELRTAFTEEYGINNFITKLMQVPYNSDNYDEYRIMVQLIAEYESNWGFFKHGLDAYNAQTFDAKAFNEELLTQIQAYAGILRFPSELYNAQDVDIPVFSQPDELILMITPRTLAGLNVQTLANVFNLDLAEIKYRTVIVDEFPIPNCDAILTTRDFFVCHDTLYKTDSFYDPNTLTNHYFLHHWGVYSVSPFVPAICFGNFETTGIDNVVYNRTAADNATSGIARLWVKYADGTYYANGAIAAVLGDNPNTWDSKAVANIINDNPAAVLGGFIPSGNKPLFGAVVQHALIVNGHLYIDDDITDGQLGDAYTGDTFYKVIGAGTNWGLNVVAREYDSDGEWDNVNRPVDVNSATHIDMYGRLHIQKTPINYTLQDANNAAYTLGATVSADWSYNDPSYVDEQEMPTIVPSTITIKPYTTV